MKRSKEKKEKSIKRQPGLPGPRSEDWGEFLRQLREIHESGGGSLRVYVKAEKNRPPRSAKLSVEDAIEQEDFLSLLMEKLGDGLYYIAVYGNYGELVGEYELLMGAPPGCDTEDEEEWEDIFRQKVIERFIDSL